MEEGGGGEGSHLYFLLFASSACIYVMHLLQLLPIGLLALLAAAQDAQSVVESNALLNNRARQDAMRDAGTFQEFCRNSRARDDDKNFLATKCTCTNLYFNLWSACAFTTNSTRPLCSELEQSCAASSINITIYNSNTETSGNYPGWSYMKLPSSNQQFDVIAAIASDHVNGTPIQIVTPIIVGLAVVAICAVAFWLYRRRKLGLRQQKQRPWMSVPGNRPRFQFPTLSRSSVHKVRELNRSESWNIEEREENLDEYEFVSYPTSLQESRESGHVRLSSTIGVTQTLPVQAWPGRSLWKGPLNRIQQLRDAIPRPWRSVKRVTVKSIPAYSKFRVDASDSDSPLSQRSRGESLLGRPPRRGTNLDTETIFEGGEYGDEEDESDGERENLIPQAHSQSTHDARPLPADDPRLESRSPDTPLDGSRRAARQIPPSTAPPSTPLPPPPPPKQDAVIQSPMVRSPQSPHAVPPAPTGPPPIPPPPSRRSPRTGMPALPSVLPPMPFSPSAAPLFSPPPSSDPNSPGQPTHTVPRPVPPLLSPPVTAPLPSPPATSPSVPVSHTRPLPPRARPSSSGSSGRSLPFTPTPAYARGVPTPIEVLEYHDSPVHSAPPYVLRPSLDASHSPSIPGLTPARSERSLRKLPIPPSSPGSIREPSSPSSERSRVSPDAARSLQGPYVSSESLGLYSTRSAPAERP
ncbi:hypothetical protein C8J57DRAFT_1294217 [Mycena rebaudengoi]|nr:hypothetical protein C8J57DRAFT_1294217 [Mycena rebaudengoi]